MPKNIIIEGLHIDDSNHPEDYQGPAIIKDFNKEWTNDSYRETFPYVQNTKIVLKNVSTASGNELRLSNNPFMFKDVQLYTE